jgi:hypothetical protein
VREGPTTNLNLNLTFAARRKAAKRTLPWALVAEELDLESPPPLQAEVIPATKKPRLEEPFSASTDEAATKLSSHGTAVSLPDVDAAHNADADLVEDTRGTRWTPEEDVKLINAVKSTCCMADWVAVAVLVPNRTEKTVWEQV